MTPDAPQRDAPSSGLWAGSLVCWTCDDTAYSERKSCDKTFDYRSSVDETERAPGGFNKKTASFRKPSTPKYRRIRSWNGYGGGP
ncbi:hypothetical protein Tbd_1802 [Thiobacillus denitrificans ATCC 25259]|uniref:Uncharacterized protein n=1 Tax=Thiobacillus denitrificans (strain ATCC 25259 / T1) TaxID=292415 RepID=Q3SHX8_THIDA|nr:hypothetical protein Tbd_1802 [Thiobacillus denitrificans ATCC 25259]